MPILVDLSRPDGYQLSVSMGLRQSLTLFRIFDDFALVLCRGIPFGCMRCFCAPSSGVSTATMSTPLPVSTTYQLPGFRNLECRGVVCGIDVRTPTLQQGDHAGLTNPSIAGATRHSDQGGRPNAAIHLGCRCCLQPVMAIPAPTPGLRRVLLPFAVALIAIGGSTSAAIAAPQHGASQTAAAASQPL